MPSSARRTSCARAPHRGPSELRPTRAVVVAPFGYLPSDSYLRTWSRSPLEDVNVLALVLAHFAAAAAAPALVGALGRRAFLVLALVPAWPAFAGSLCDRTARL